MLWLFAIITVMNDIKKIYLQLKALNESLVHNTNDKSRLITDSGVWESFNNTLSTLFNMTQDSHYESLKVHPTDHVLEHVSPSSFASSVYQATSYLFETQKTSNLSDEYPPEKPKAIGGGITQTTISQQENSQNTSINIEFNQTLTYITEVLVEAKSEYPEGTKERAFIDKVKSGLSTAKSTAEIIKLILGTGSELGIALDVLVKLFK